MKPSAFFYVPLTLPSPPFWGRGLRRELSRTIKVRGHELSIRRSIIYMNINNMVKSENFPLTFLGVQNFVIPVKTGIQTCPCENREPNAWIPAPRSGRGQVSQE